MKKGPSFPSIVLIASLVANALGPSIPPATAQTSPDQAPPAAEKTPPSVPPAAPQTSPDNNPPTAEKAPPAVPMPDVEAPSNRAPAAELPPALPPAEAPAKPDAPPSPASPAARAQSRQVTFTLRQLGAQGPLALRGASELSGVKFGVRADEVVTAASLKLSGAMSPSLIPQFSNVTVTLNEQYVGTIPVSNGKARFDNLEMSIDPIYFALDNRLNFRFSGRYTDKCNDPLSGLLWSTIADTSALTLTLVRLPPQRDLSHLPLPFFDTHDRQPLVLPFVLAPSPNNAALQASGIVASWFGQLASFRGASFPTSAAVPKAGNAVVLATTDTLPPGVKPTQIAGPTIAVLPNENDASGSILLVAGRNGDELVNAAKALVVGNRTLGGETAVVTPPTLMTRKPYDAPAWIPTDRPIRLGQLVEATDLQAFGYAPGPLRVPFRTAPDLYTWRDRGFPAEIRYRGPPGPIVDLAVSRLDVAVNNLYLASLPLADDSARTLSWLPAALQPKDVRQLLSSGNTSTVRKVDLPVYDVFGQNELQFAFDTRPLGRGACVGIPGDLRMGIDPDSTIDLSRANRIANLPNLAFFVNSGFPFSRMADLSETAVILSAQADLREVQVYLELLGRVSSLTGLPALGVVVVRPDEVRRVSDRDLLMVGTIDKLQAGADLLRDSPFRLEGQTVRIGLSSPIDNIRRSFGLGGEDRASPARATLQAIPTSTFLAMIGTESPLSRGRSLVAVVAGSGDALQGALPVMRDSEQAAKIQGDLAILTDGRPISYKIGDSYIVGTLPLWLYPSWMLQDSPVGLLLVLLAGTGLLGIVLFRALRRRASARKREIEAETGA